MTEKEIAKEDYTKRIEILMDRIHEWGEKQQYYDCGEEAVLCALRDYIIKLNIPKAELER